MHQVNISVHHAIVYIYVGIIERIAIPTMARLSPSGGKQVGHLDTNAIITLGPCFEGQRPYSAS